MKGLIERREYPFEVRAESDGKLRGLAAVFNQEAVIGGSFREVIKPGAFTKTLQERRVKALWNHQTIYPMGDTERGTLVLEQSTRGLETEIDPPKQAPYSGFVENIQRGEVDSMSFGFEVIKENIQRGEGDEMILREITEIRLFEVSPVTFPAYEGTEIEARATQLVDHWKASGKLADTVVEEQLEDRDSDEGRTTQDAGTSDPTPEPDEQRRGMSYRKAKLLLKERTLL